VRGDLTAYSPPRYYQHSRFKRPETACVNRLSSVSLGSPRHHVKQKGANEHSPSQAKVLSDDAACITPTELPHIGHTYSTIVADVDPLVLSACGDIDRLYDDRGQTNTGVTWNARRRRRG